MTTILHSKKNGFTLVELAIVLVIIGLITAGIVGSQALLRQSEIRSVITGFHSLNTAYKAFSFEYNAVTGDFDDAWNYWGTDCFTPEDTTPTEDECNGDGNKQVHKDDLYWTHLRLAEIINQEVGLSVNVAETSSVEAIDSPVEGGIFRLTYVSGTLFEQVGTFIVLQARNHLGILPVKSAKNLDKKMDDGNASTGFLLGISGNAEDCTTSDWSGAEGSADYDLSSTATPCRSYYRIN